MMLSKTRFLEFEHCPKAFWAGVHRPELIERQAPGANERMLAADGAAFEEIAAAVYRSRASGHVAEQHRIEAGGCLAILDLFDTDDEAGATIVEIKSGTRPGDHLVDAAFQCEVALRAGLAVRRVLIGHPRSDFVRGEDPSAHDLVAFTDVTREVEDMGGAVRERVERALRLIEEPEIDMDGCPCRHLGNADRRCPAFHAFNPDIDERSAHLLPRISSERLMALDREGRLDIDQVGHDDVTSAQRAVLEASQSGEAVIDRAALARFRSGLEWPIHFYDFETTASAIPLAKGHRPHQAMPVQFSVHVLGEDGSVEHREYLSLAAGDEVTLCDALAHAVGPEGSCLVWNAAFEKGCNRRLADMLPGHAGFLQDLTARTVDLMVPFKQSYVDPAFGGSVSIKRVLPVLCPHLRYDADAVHDGAGAMVAWRRMIASADPVERDRLARELKSYCRTDTLAMVEIFRFLEGVIRADRKP